MQVRHIDLSATLDVARGGVVVCIPVQRSSEHFAACLRSVLDHTPPDVPVLVCDVGAGDPAVFESPPQPEPRNDPERDLLYIRAGQRAGRLAAVNATLAAIAPADAVLVSSYAEVVPNWLDRLRHAAYSDSTVATASALSRIPEDWHDADAATVGTRSLRLYPRIAAAMGPCVYVRRSALELVGDLDAGLVSGRGKGDEFSRACVQRGLSHVIADDVLVGDRFVDGSSEPWRRSPTDRVETLARSLSRVRRTLSRLSVVIDARILSKPTTGTQVHVLEVIAAVARTQRVNLAVVVPDHLDDDAARCLRSLRDVTLLTHDQASDATRPRADLVHRPYQVNNPGDLPFLLGLAERLVVTQQDLMGYYNPSYFSSAEAHDAYRQLTRTTAAIADRVLFFSAHARDNALADDLIDPARADIVPIGVDHKVTSVDQRPVRPAAARFADGDEVLLCLGSDYLHKNRLFALRVADELERRHGWHGRLVLAGPHVAHGSSAPDEEGFLAQKQELADMILDVGHVSEAEKAWLLDRASLVIYPTVCEGFGLVPFEAASHGVPCMWAAGTSLSEVLPDEAAAIVAWDDAQSADRALELLHDERARAYNLESIRTAGKRLTWYAAATHLLEVYEATCDAPRPASSVLERRYGLLTRGLSEDAMRLVGPGGSLPDDMERPLLALATHPQIGTPVFGAVRLGYRTSYKLRRLVPQRWRKR